jgi:5-methylcytosine-specific restriction endonuclease McrA
MVSTGQGRTGRPWRRVQAQCMAEGEANGTPCWHCGLPIDYEFTKQYPLHRMAGTAHHIVGLAQNGDPLDPNNLTPMHRGCNTIESNKLRGMNRTNTRHVPQPPRNSRRW